MTYKEILKEETAKEVDTDYGKLRAYWATNRRLIEQRTERAELLKWLQHVGNWWGPFKMVEMKGDIIDAKLL